MSQYLLRVHWQDAVYRFNGIDQTDMLQDPSAFQFVLPS